MAHFPSSAPGVPPSTPDGNVSFGKQFLKNLVGRMPYSKGSVIDNIEELNPKFKQFFDLGSRREELIKGQSIIAAPMTGDDAASGMIIDKSYHNYMYATIDRDKGKRLRDYRVMAAHAEMSQALDEIADECIVKDENGDIIRLEVKNEQPAVKDTIQKEFKRFIDNYDLEDKGWSYFRAFLIDGELFFENIIHDKRPTAGILGIVNVPTELCNPIYDNVQNSLIKGFLVKKVLTELERREVNNNTTEILIPLDKSQVTYIHSDIWNEDKTVRLPYLEQARQPYKKLSLIEDSIIIYRLVRAPERLVFNVEVGNMPQPKAENYLKRLMQQYWTKKSFDASQGKSGKGVGLYDPQSMLDSYWFAKRNGQAGTTVEQLPGGANLGQLDDLNYFLRKLYKALKVPSSRLDPDAPFTDGAEITREELRFAKFIIRLQRQFASGLKDGFIAHLKLRNLWKQFEMKEWMVNLYFNPPSHFHVMREQQVLSLKQDNYDKMSQNPGLSVTFCQKKYLGYNDDEVKINREWMRKDAAFLWEIEQIKSYGPNWKEAALSNAPSGGEEAAGGAAPAGGGGGGGSSLPPSFGPGPQTPEAPESGETPEGGEEAEAPETAQPEA